MTRRDISDEIESQYNQILSWWSQANFQNEERTARLLERFKSGPDAFIDPELSPRENWELIKVEYDLTTEQEHRQRMLEYEERDKRRVDRHLADGGGNTTVTIRGTSLPEYVGNPDIIECLEMPLTYEDEQPPSDSDYSSPTIVANFKPFTPIKQVIEHTNDFYEFDTSAVGLQRLLRYGLPEVKKTIDAAIPGGATISDYHTMARKAARYVQGEPHEYARLEEDVKLALDYDRLPKDSNRILWWEKLYAEWMANQIGLDMSDVHQMAIAEAGHALGKDGQLPEPLHDDIRNIHGEADVLLERRAGTYMTAFRNTIFEAVLKGHGQEIVRICEEETPNLYSELIGDIDVITETVEAVDPGVFEKNTIEREEVIAIEQLDVLRDRSSLPHLRGPKFTPLSHS